MADGGTHPGSLKSETIGFEEFLGIFSRVWPVDEPVWRLAKMLSPIIFSGSVPREGPSSKVSVESSDLNFRPAYNKFLTIGVEIISFFNFMRFSLPNLFLRSGSLLSDRSAELFEEVGNTHKPNRHF